MKAVELKELAKHIAEARPLGRAAADAMDDGGTANLDRVCLHLPSTREASVKAAGISAFRLRSYFALCASFGQGNKNTAGVKAMAEYLKGKGYEAFVWYQID